MSATAIAAKATSWLAGYIPDLPTPFDPSGNVDLNALAAAQFKSERGMQAANNYR